MIATVLRYGSEVDRQAENHPIGSKWSWWGDCVSVECMRIFLLLNRFMSGTHKLVHELLSLSADRGHSRENHGLGFAHLSHG